MSAGLLACLFTISKHSHPKYEEIVYDDDNGPTKSTTNVGSLFGNIGIYRKFSASSEKQANNINWDAIQTTTVIYKQLSNEII